MCETIGTHKSIKIQIIQVNKIIAMKKSTILWRKIKNKNASIKNLPLYGENEKQKCKYQEVERFIH